MKPFNKMPSPEDPQYITYSITARIDYLKSALADVVDVEFKTPFEQQLAEYLWDELNKAILQKIGMANHIRE